MRSKSSRSSDAYMCRYRPSLVETMAYSVPSHYLNQYWLVVSLNFCNKLQSKFQNTKFFIHENYRKYHLQNGDLFVAASCVNSLRPSNSIWRLRSGRTLARIIACCLPTPSHHPSKCWHIINGDPQHSPGDNFTGMLKIRVYKMNSVIDFCHISQGSICQRKQSTIQWRHNELDSVSNHQPYDCLFNCLFRRRPKKTSKLRVTGLCVGNSPMTGEFPTQRASNAENIFIWWRHHDLFHWACYIHWQSVQVNVG